MDHMLFQKEWRKVFKTNQLLNQIKKNKKLINLN